MKAQVFTHENEILAMAPLGEADRGLFSKQSVQLIENGLNEIQWGFHFAMWKGLAFPTEG